MDFNRLADLAGGGMQRGIAADVWPKGATLECKRCDHAEHATSAECGRYLARGWPKHCGETMTVETIK